MKLNHFIGLVPGYWLLYLAIELCLYRSKSPEWIGLYSSQKALGIVFLLLSSWIAFKYLSFGITMLIYKMHWRSSWSSIPPIKLFLFLAILFRLVLFHVPCSVGEDLAPQFLSAKQWLVSETDYLNLLVSPNPKDLNQNIPNWMMRPPGASWLPIPGLFLGFNLGHSLHLVLFILSIMSGLGWLTLAKKFSIPQSGLLLLSFILALQSACGSLSVASASVLTAATFPWLIVWAIHIGKEWSIPSYGKVLQWKSMLLFFCIGLHAFFKLSSLLTLAAVLVLPFAICLPTSLKSKPKFFYRGCVSILLFIVPYLLLTKINENMTGLSSDELYSKQDYNAQHALWGRHFTESTRGGMLALSFFASPGYASPVQSVINQFRDFLQQSDFYSKILDQFKLNARIVGSCILGIPISILILISLRILREQADRNALLVYIALFTVPFLGLGAVSYHHGFNYLIFHAYTKEFYNIFILLGLTLIFSLDKQICSTFLNRVLIGIFLGMPIISSVSTFSTFTTNSLAKFSPSKFETGQGFGGSEFSNALTIVSGDSTDPNDVCFFLCAGDQRDYCLRTPMRSMSLHWAKGNITKFSKLGSSVSLNLYCLIDPLLLQDDSFINQLLDKLPHNSEIARLSPEIFKVAIRTKTS